MGLNLDAQSWVETANVVAEDKLMADTRGQSLAITESNALIEEWQEDECFIARKSLNTTTTTTTLGSFFSSMETDPAGITNGLLLWLKADVGVTGTTEVSVWSNQSAVSIDDATNTGVTGPSLNTEGINYQPSLTFDRSNAEGLVIGTANPVFINGTTYSNINVFLVIKPVDASQFSWIYRADLAVKRINLHAGNSWQFDTPHSAIGRLTLSNADTYIKDGAVTLLSLNSGTSSIYGVAANKKQVFSVNGKSQNSDNSGESFVGGGDPFDIGRNISGYDTKGNSFDGEIAEIIIYNALVKSPSSSTKSLRSATVTLEIPAQLLSAKSTLKS